MSYQTLCTRVLCELPYLGLLQLVEERGLIFPTKFVISFFLHVISFKICLLSLEALVYFSQLFFPICHLKHWFVFVVDFKWRVFAFLDSLYGPQSDYQLAVRRPLVSLIH